LSQYVFDGPLKHALGWILFAPSFHPDVDCGVVGPDAVTRSRARYPPVRRSEKACEPIGIARGLIYKFPFRMLYRSGLARRAIMKCGQVLSARVSAYTASVKVGLRVASRSDTTHKQSRTHTVSHIGHLLLPPLPRSERILALLDGIDDLTVARGNIVSLHRCSRWS
jgi:hypothetical protein